MVSTVMRLSKTATRQWPGVAIAVVIALAASFIAATYGGPTLLYALLFGLAFHFLSSDPQCQPGIEFCSKTLLRIGVALLGARVTLAQMTSLGVGTIVLVLAAVTSTIAVVCLLARSVDRPLFEGVLAGGAVAICGASAALAIAAVMPQSKENERFTLLTVVGVTALSTLAMIVYPLLVRFSGLDANDAGIFIGATIHDVAQVVGAGYLISSHTGDVATIVKLTRVTCLVPVALTLSVLFQGRRGSSSEVDLPPLIPVFLIGFVVLMLANTYGVLAPSVLQALGSVSRACLVTAIAALGIKTSLQALASLGWRPVLLLVAGTVWIAALVISVLLLRQFVAK